VNAMPDLTAAERYRPALHFTTPVHWINDPNGLVYVDGHYHLFFQHNPFGDQWGHMSWGHAVSTDLLRWEHLPLAIPEDERASIFSGSIVVDHANTSGFGDGQTPPWVAIYTACLRRPEGGQMQDIAFSLDGGLSWTKYAGNPVLDLNMRDFRDPKVFWHEPSQRWIMVVVLSEERCAHLYASDNLRTWSFLSVIEAPRPDLGIWECPDLMRFTSEGEEVWLFKVDVMAGHPSGVAGALLMFGEFDGHRFTPDPDTPLRWADHGADFYAALSWANLPGGPGQAGQHLWLGWMNAHAYAREMPTSPWRGAMSIPRWLSVRRRAGSWELLQTPALGDIRQKPPALTWQGRSVQGAHSMKLIEAADPTVFLLEVTFGPVDLDRADAPTSCAIHLRSKAQQSTRVIWHPGHQEIQLDRSQSGFRPSDERWAQLCRIHAPELRAADGLRLRVLIDRCSIEVFIDEGQYTLTQQILPDGDATAIELVAEGGPLSSVSLDAWALA